MLLLISRILRISFPGPAGRKGTACRSSQLEPLKDVRSYRRYRIFTSLWNWHASSPPALKRWTLAEKAGTETNSRRGTPTVATRRGIICRSQARGAEGGLSCRRAETTKWADSKHFRSRPTTVLLNFFFLIISPMLGAVWGTAMWL